MYKNISSNKFCKLLQNNLANVLIVLTENKLGGCGNLKLKKEEMLSKEWTNVGSELAWITPFLP